MIDWYLQLKYSSLLLHKWIFIFWCHLRSDFWSEQIEIWWEKKQSQQDDHFGKKISGPIPRTSQIFFHSNPRIHLAEAQFQQEFSYSSKLYRFQHNFVFSHSLFLPRIYPPRITSWNSNTNVNEKNKAE